MGDVSSRLAPLAPLALLLAAALPAAADPSDLAGTWRLQGQNHRGRYQGTATLEHDAQGKVCGQLALTYVSWSWLRFRYVQNGEVEAARIEGRVEGRELVVTRTGSGLTGSLAREGATVRYRIARRTTPTVLTGDLGGIESLSGSYGSGVERLDQHRPAASSGARALERLRRELEQASHGLLYTSESDHPLRVVVLPGAADYVRDVEGVKRELRIPLYRPGQKGDLEQTLGRRARHRPGETAEEAARVERYALLLRTLRADLFDLQVYRVGGPEAYLDAQGRLMGSIEVIVLGRTRAGDLVGVRTISVET